MASWFKGCGSGSGGDGGSPRQRAIEDEEHEHGDEIGDVPEQLERRRRGTIPEQAVEHAPDRALVRQEATDVERRAGVRVEAGLAVRFVERTCVD